MSTTRVYISSTYRDLKVHRQQVIDFFQKMPDRFDLISMEGYVADDITPLQKCLDDVASCDLYVLIIARRYGFIVPDTSVNPDQYSITEMEYRKAEEKGKRILAFFADEAADFEGDKDAQGNPLQEHEQKLAAFKVLVRNKRLTHPEGFVSPYHLALQVSESLMRSAMLSKQMNDSRRYCCDRGRQLGEYLTIRSKSRFKTIIIHGDSRELGLNLVTRLCLFTLNLDEQDINPPLTFEEILTSHDYEKCRASLLMTLYYKFFQSTNLQDLSINGFLQAIAPLNKVLAVTVNCDDDKFNERQKAFLLRFMEEFYAACQQVPGQPLYLFLYLEDLAPPASSDDRIRELMSGLPNGSAYCHTLPQLNQLSRQELKTWMLQFVSTDEGSVLELLDLDLFTGLAADFTMKDANASLRRFIRKLNQEDPDIMDIIA